MRIMHVTDRRFPPASSEGGAPQCVASLVYQQRRVGNEVLVATTADARAEDVWELGCVEEGEKRLLTKAREYNVDVVHFHAHAAKMQSVVQAAGFPSVAHVHGNHLGKPADVMNAIYVSERHAALHGGSVYIHNGIDLSAVPFAAMPTDCLAFLGKVKHSKKGADTAVSVARRTERTLKLIGGRKLSIPQSWLPWQRRVTALGVLGGEQKLAALGQASALLFPVRWEEPFGLVLIEAMACGTPVIGFDRGAVSEIVDHGVTGFVVRDFEEMCDAVSRIGEIDRTACRRHVEKRFSIDRTVDRLMDCYQRAIAGGQW